jgi:predicted acylesterase/phospholipase RssA
MSHANAIAVRQFLSAARAQLKASNGLNIPFNGTAASSSRPKTVLGGGANGGNAVHLGFVFGGGGAKGDFQLGAINAVYDLFQLDSGVGTPPPIDIITGISVGSLAATAIASAPFVGASVGGIVGGRTELNNIWNSIGGPSDIYVDGPLLSSLRSTINTLAANAALGLAAGSTGLVGAVGYPLAAPFLDAAMLGGMLTSAIGTFLALQGPASTALTAVEQGLSNIVNSQLVPTANSLSSVFSSVPTSVLNILNNIAVPIQSEIGDISSFCNQLLTDINNVASAFNGLGGVAGITALGILAGPAVIGALVPVVATLTAVAGTALATLGAASGAALGTVIGLSGTLIGLLTGLVGVLTAVSGMIGSVLTLSVGVIASAAVLNVAPIAALIDGIETLVDVVNVIVDVSNVLNDPATQAGLFSFAPLFGLLAANVSAQDVTAINNGPTALHIGFTSLESTRYRFADKSWTLPNLITGVQASVSQPVFFPAVPMSLTPTGQGTYQLVPTTPINPAESYVDGGVRSVVALSPAIRAMRNPATGRNFHLNIIIVFACSNLLAAPWQKITLGQPPQTGPITGILNTLLRTLDIFELTQYADAMLEADTGIRQAFAESSNKSFSSEFDYLAQNAKVIWSAGSEPANFPSLHDLTGRPQDRGKPMPGDTIIILIEPDVTFDEFHSPFDFNGTNISGVAGVAAGATIIGESIKFGNATAQFVLKGVGGTPSWSLLPAYLSGQLVPFDPLANAI